MQQIIDHTNLDDATNKFGCPGLKRTDVTVSFPQRKLLTGSDLYEEARKVSYYGITCLDDRKYARSLGKPKTYCDSIYLLEHQLWQIAHHPTGDQQP